MGNSSLRSFAPSKVKHQRFKRSFLALPFILLGCSGTQTALKCLPADPIEESPPEEVKSEPTFELNDKGYFVMGGANVMAFSDFYPEGHQGGVTVIQDGVRLAAGGDVRLEAAPGQWQPVPKMLNREVLVEKSQIKASLIFPDEDKNQKGFNPVDYPDLTLKYQVSVESKQDEIHISIDLDEPLPEEWVGRVGFNLEFFPGEYFGKSFNIDGKSGSFPRQVNGPISKNQYGQYEASKLGRGKLLNVAPEDQFRHLQLKSDQELELWDGRTEHNNGWFIARAPLAAGKTQGAATLILKTFGDKDWQYGPVLHLSQVGYHPAQEKQLTIEIEPRSDAALKNEEAQLLRVNADGSFEEVLKATPKSWGDFLRYHYLQFDFSAVKTPGSYLIRFAGKDSNLFRIDEDIYERDVWQPTLEYFLPVQMCHMRVNEAYRVWHGECHADDARMAPTDTNHFDGYLQGPSTLTKYRSGQSVPGLAVGGWHDAGDYDLRVESQIGTVRLLAQMIEQFDLSLDSTTIDQAAHLVEIHRPDGISDAVQQIEHGALSILGAYDALGRLYRGIISPTNRQYVLLGDGVNMTDGLRYNPRLKAGEKRNQESGDADDRWVFTEKNTERELGVVAGLAIASRVLKEDKSALSQRCLKAAEELLKMSEAPSNAKEQGARVTALAELYLSTSNQKYADEILASRELIIQQLKDIGWTLSPLRHQLDAPEFWSEIDQAMHELGKAIEAESKETPFGVPYRPDIWGAGWGIQEFAVRQYFLAEAWPQDFKRETLYAAIHFVLGHHPGLSTASFASGVGARSLTTAYGTNRADFSYIPGGVASGTALIRPDLPELKDWPYFWQQGEYVIGGGAENFMFMVLAANHWLEAPKSAAPAATASTAATSASAAATPAAATTASATTTATTAKP